MTAGFHPIQGVDLNDLAWPAPALEPVLRKPFIQFNHDSDDPVPEWVFEDDDFRRSLERVLLRVLDDGATVLELDDLVAGLHQYDPTSLVSG